MVLVDGLGLADRAPSRPARMMLGVQYIMVGVQGRNLLYAVGGIARLDVVCAVLKSCARCCAIRCARRDVLLAQ